MAFLNWNKSKKGNVARNDISHDNGDSESEERPELPKISWLFWVAIICFIIGLYLRR